MFEKAVKACDGKDKKSLDTRQIKKQSKGGDWKSREGL